MGALFTRLFWLDATERAIKSGAQYALLTLLGGAVVGTIDSANAQVVNAFLVNYVTLGGAFLGGALISYLTSLGTAKVSGTDTASLVVDTKPLLKG